MIEVGYFEYGNFEKQSGELKAKLELKANLTGVCVFPEREFPDWIFPERVFPEKNILKMIFPWVTNC